MDQKNSILVNRQVPEYIRDEYPVFVSFLEAYYEYLETKQGSQINDLLNVAKDIRRISDVDDSIDQFEDSFFNTFATLLPKDVAVDKAFLIKHVLPLYLAKGNEKSFKLLFRMLFADDVEIKLPKNDILRASDGKWTVDNTLRIETDIRSVYTANGSNTTFYLAQTSGESDITVYVDDVLKTLATDYYVRKETRKLIFNTAPAANSVIKVYYNAFDITQLANRKVVGLSSGASAIIERAAPRIITDKLNFGLPFELFVSDKSYTGNFVNGEEVSIDILDSNGTKIVLTADTFSIITKIEIVNGGANYNVGDIVPIIGGGFTTQATAKVSAVSAGAAAGMTVYYGGAGYNVASILTSTGTSPLTLTGAVDIVDGSGANSANTYTVSTDLISTYANVLISNSNYGFPAGFTENVNTRIVDALTPVTLTGIGPLTNAFVLYSDVTSNVSQFISDGAVYQAGDSYYGISAFRSIGRIDVVAGGTGYKVGDEIVFGANPAGCYGQDAAAAVKNVSATGAITKVEIQPARIAGTANVLNNTNQIVGTGTDFTNDLRVGDKIVIRSQERYINAITSSTTANVNVAFQFFDSTTWSNNSPVGSFARSIVGGINYAQNNFPTLTVSSANTQASGANVKITALMGDGEQIKSTITGNPGQILEITLVSGGSGYRYVPQVDLTGSGNGLASANAVVGSSYVSLPGRWTTSDSILSSLDRKIQGRDYYVDFSYVTSSLTEFKKYKTILKDLLHPAGFAKYAEVNKSADFASTGSLTATKTNTISGLVTVTAGSIYIVGNNTKFNIANTRGIMTVGSTISVNGESKTISSIISNTNVAVSSTFTYSAAAQPLIITT